ncbi:PREDICTED: F-box At5g49610 [Prunus dulcis]|uniref:PREDICTED: F-box At5g49610 n=1 Tax=Prunus dulcis TaxID=3755 RepID=A0A5E4ECZ5_PRUDU|nr:PREDICTED: F-box At5g49610 [Prunus dulcis]
MQYAELPPTASQCHKSVRVGIICNVVPDYKFEEDDWKGNNIHLNVECRFTVVRILPPVEYANDEKKAAAGKNLCLSKRGVYSFDPEMIPINAYCVMIAFYPNNKDIFYLHVRRDIIKWNIRTGEWSKLFEHWATHRYYYTVVLPWWPTPVPRLAQQHAHRSVAEEVAAASR